MTTLPFPTSVQAIFFDFDGTLIHSQQNHEKAWKALMSELHLPPAAWNLIQQMRGYSSLQITQELAKLYSPNLDLARSWSQKKGFYYETERAKDPTPLFPGVQQGLLQLWERAFRLAIVSNGRSQDVVRLAQKMGIHDHFEEILTRDHVSFPKPHPELYESALEKFGLNHHQAIAVEDSPVGATAACSAQLKCAVVLHNRTQSEFDPRCHFFENIQAFFDWILANHPSR